MRTTPAAQLAIEYTNMDGQKTHVDQRKKKPLAAEPPPHTVGSWFAAKARQLARPGTAGPILLTCLALTLVYKKRNKFIGWGSSRKEETAAAAPAARPRRPMLQRSLSIAALHGGKLTLQRIMDSQEARIDETTLDDALNELPRLLSKEPYSFSQLQRCIAKLEMSGKEDEAIAKISEAWQKADQEKKTHEAYELQMLLVELHIYKGEYKKALDCNCLNDKEISDARGPLYKAVIYSIEGNSTKAEECYKEFQEIRSRFHWPDGLREGSPLYGVVHDFQSFESIVKNLKKEIEQAHKNKQTLEMSQGK